MDSMAAFARGAAARGQEQKVFDWHKAAQLIVERKPEIVSAGLRGDWEWTGGTIYAGGRPVDADDTYTFLASTWATPEIDIDGHVEPCFLMQSQTPDGAWVAETYWPDSAKKILSEND